MHVFIFLLCINIIVLNCFSYLVFSVCAHNKVKMGYNVFIFSLFFVCVCAHNRVRSCCVASLCFTIEYLHTFDDLWHGLCVTYMWQVMGKLWDCDMWQKCWLKMHGELHENVDSYPHFDFKTIPFPLPNYFYRTPKLVT